MRELMKEGWGYAPAFFMKFHMKEKKMDFVRRRRYLRELKPEGGKIDGKKCTLPPILRVQLKSKVSTGPVPFPPYRRYHGWLFRKSLTGFIPNVLDQFCFLCLDEKDSKKTCFTRTWQFLAFWLFEHCCKWQSRQWRWHHKPIRLRERYRQRLLFHDVNRGRWESTPRKTTVNLLIIAGSGLISSKVTRAALLHLPVIIFLHRLCAWFLRFWDFGYSVDPNCPIALFIRRKYIPRLFTEQISLKRLGCWTKQ